jgi:hypothetical protein
LFETGSPENAQTGVVHRGASGASRGPAKKLLCVAMTWTVWHRPLCAWNSIARWNLVVIRPLSCKQPNWGGTRAPRHPLSTPAPLSPGERASVRGFFFTNCGCRERVRGTGRPRDACGGPTTDRADVPPCAAHHQEVANVPASGLDQALRFLGSSAVTLLGRAVDRTSLRPAAAP